mmetsp:Transcript_31584/g.63550  ORF Transcript_31584/g.63550 Transcript_31584/m.63550 type:complete len:133 (+) Transcript_31584:744-1142(+)
MVWEEWAACRVWVACQVWEDFPEVGVPWAMVLEAETRRGLWPVWMSLARARIDEMVLTMISMTTTMMDDWIEWMSEIGLGRDVYYNAIILMIGNALKQMRVFIMTLMLDTSIGYLVTESAICHIARYFSKVV